MASKPVIQRILIALFVASLASALLVGMHYYIAKRLVLDPGAGDVLTQRPRHCGPVEVEGVALRGQGRQHRGHAPCPV